MQVFGTSDVFTINELAAEGVNLGVIGSLLLLISSSWASGGLA